MASNNKGSCPLNSSCDWVGCQLNKIGVTRSTLVTLALVPFAWNGVTWLARSLAWAFDTVVGFFTAVGS